MARKGHKNILQSCDRLHRGLRLRGNKTSKTVSVAGVDILTAWALIAELGADMSVFGVQPGGAPGAARGAAPRSTSSG